jgi:glycosyltransferase involved in cell wall biosynthesis
LKILFVHNQYGVASGEEAMIQRITSLLKRKGHDIEVFFRSSKEIGTSVRSKAGAFFSGIYSVASKRQLAKVLEQFNPDVVQIQNLYPLISPSILPMLDQACIPIVMRLSNYRLICPSGTFLSRGEICERCRGGNEYWCVVRNCERTRAKSLGYALRNWNARVFGLYSKNVTRYYAQTEFQKEVLCSEGFDAGRIDVIPNMVEQISQDIGSSTGTYAAYVGRMSPEKGIEVFLEAARRCPNLRFKVAGDHWSYQSLAAIPGNVEIVGHLSGDALDDFYRNSRLVVVPSVWYEGFPSVIIETMRFAKPVVASRIGGLPEIVDDMRTGRLFEPGNVDDLVRILEELWSDGDAVSAMGKAGAKKVAESYSPESYYQKLMSVYELAITEVASRQTV